MITEALKKVAAGNDLTYDEAYACMDEIFGGEVSEIVTAGYLTALHMKGETTDEITASANGMRNHAEELPHDGLEVLEIVGIEQKWCGRCIRSIGCQYYDCTGKDGRGFKKM